MPLVNRSKYDINLHSILFQVHSLSGYRVNCLRLAYDSTQLYNFLFLLLHNQLSSKMRQKRAKAYRKLMHLYCMSFGFRQPYQILGTSCDIPHHFNMLTTISVS